MDEEVHAASAWVLKEAIQQKQKMLMCGDIVEEMKGDPTKGFYITANIKCVRV